MVSNLRRLAADHAALHGDNLPPYYLFPPDDGRFATTDDLSQLNVLVTGPPGTPYADGLWRLHLKIPENYPNSPPKASFRTKIWHPNVEELTGAVCVDTLKRDWKSKLTLRDVLVTISCLLIHPNPDSALNAAAGTLLRDDYGAFAHQAKLMTSIHAKIQPAMRAAVKRARSRGEDSNSNPSDEEKMQDLRPRKQARLQANISTSAVRSVTPTDSHQSPHVDVSSQPVTPMNPDAIMIDSETESLAGSVKENDMSLSPGPIHAPPPTPQRTSPGKRPFSVISTCYPGSLDEDMMLIESDSDTETVHMSPSEQNISANINSQPQQVGSPLRTPPQRMSALAMFSLSKGANSPYRTRDLRVWEDVADRLPFAGDGKENRDSVARNLKVTCDLPAAAINNGSSALPAGQNPTLSVSSVSSGASRLSGPRTNKQGASGGRKATAAKPKARIGIRRL